MKKLQNTLFVLSEDAYLTLDGENVVVSREKAETARFPLHTLESILCFTYPGASPEQVEADVTKPLEDSLSTLNGVKNVTSQSSENYSLVILEYQDDTNMDSALVKASTAVNQIEGSLPELAATPMLIEMSPDMMATQYVAVDSQGMDVYELSALVEDTILPRLERLDGVASVSTIGLVERTVEVTLDEGKIDALNDRLLALVSDRLAEARGQLDAGEAQIKDGLRALDEAEKQLADGQTQLDTQKENLTQQLRSAIDRLLPGCAGLEDLLRRLQREGYELKRGKYISARAPGQERFTRLKALGADYAEEALTARIAGRPSPSRQPKQRTGKPSLLIDIQNNIKAQQSAGYKHWATIENLKRAAETLNFLTEHGIGSLEDLSERCDGAAAATARVKADLRATKKEMERLTLTMKHAATYRQLRPLYEEYRQSRDKEKFLRGHEGEIILFEAAARELKRLDAVPLPATKRLRAEMDGLTARRTALQSEYRKAQREEREYDTLRQNVEALLEKPREAEPQRQRNHELE